MSFLDSFVLVLTGFITLAAVLTLINWAFCAVIAKIKLSKQKEVE